MTDRLSKINESLSRKLAARNEFDNTIQETEAAYMKVRSHAVAWHRHGSHPLTTRLFSRSSKVHKHCCMSSNASPSTSRRRSKRHRSGGTNSAGAVGVEWAIIALLAVVCWRGDPMALCLVALPALFFPCTWCRVEKGCVCQSLRCACEQASIGAHALPSVTAYAGGDTPASSNLASSAWIRLTRNSFVVLLLSNASSLSRNWSVKSRIRRWAPPPHGVRSSMHARPTTTAQVTHTCISWFCFPDDDAATLTTFVAGDALLPMRIPNNDRLDDGEAMAWAPEVVETTVGAGAGAGAETAVARAGFALPWCIALYSASSSRSCCASCFATWVATSSWFFSC